MTVFGFAVIAVPGTAAVLQGGTLAVVVVVVMTVMFATVIFTQPIWARVGPDGVTRRCPARTQTVPWEEIDAFDRLRRGGGLVIRLANGRHLVVCDRMEGHGEHVALRAVVERYQSAVAVPGPPELDQKPTDLYRRGRTGSV